jgi:ParB-like chromosome segregation protein Spo0J
VANTLRLLQLSPSLKAQVGSGLLSAGHARALLSVRDPEAVAEMIINKGLSVRDVERIVQEEAEGVISVGVVEIILVVEEEVVTQIRSRRATAFSSKERTVETGNLN